MRITTHQWWSEEWALGIRIEPRKLTKTMVRRKARTSRFWFCDLWWDWRGCSLFCWHRYRWTRKCKKETKSSEQWRKDYLYRSDMYFPLVWTYGHDKSATEQSEWTIPPSPQERESHICSIEWEVYDEARRCDTDERRPKNTDTTRPRIYCRWDLLTCSAYDK